MGNDVSAFPDQFTIFATAASNQASI